MKRNTVSNKNHEGYSDPTARQAINSLCDTSPKAGEVWTAKGVNNVEHEYVILAEKGNYSVVCQLYEERSIEEDSVEFVSRAKRYACPGRISYMSNKRMKEFVKIANRKEFGKLMDSIFLMLFPDKSLDDIKAPVEIKEDVQEDIKKEPAITVEAVEPVAGDDGENLAKICFDVIMYLTSIYREENIDLLTMIKVVDFMKQELERLGYK